MASTTPVNDTPVPASAPVASPAPAAVKADAAPKADPAPASAPAKIEAKIVEATKSVAASIEKVAQKVVAPIKAAAPAPAVKTTAPKPVAPAKAPVAKKKAVVKTAPKIAAKAISKTVKPTVAAATAKAKIISAKEETIMEATIKNAADKAKTMMSDANAKSTQAFGEMNEFTKGNIEAIVESGKIAAKGVEAMGQDAAEYSRKQFESATAALKSLSTVKSPTDFFKLQGDYMRTSFDALVAQTSKNTETFLKLAGEVAQPIQNRVSIAAEKVKIAA